MQNLNNKCENYNFNNIMNLYETGYNNFKKAFVNNGTNVPDFVKESLKTQQIKMPLNRIGNFDSKNSLTIINKNKSYSAKKLKLVYSNFRITNKNIINPSKNQTDTNLTRLINIEKNDNLQSNDVNNFKNIKNLSMTFTKVRKRNISEISTPSKPSNILFQKLNMYSNIRKFKHLSEKNINKILGMKNEEKEGIEENINNKINKSKNKNSKDFTISNFNSVVNLNTIINPNNINKKLINSDLNFFRPPQDVQNNNFNTPYNYEDEKVNFMPILTKYNNKSQNDFNKTELVTKLKNNLTSLNYTGNNFHPTGSMNTYFKSENDDEDENYNNLVGLNVNNNDNISITGYKKFKQTNFIYESLKIGTEGKKRNGNFNNHLDNNYFIKNQFSQLKIDVSKVKNNVKNILGDLKKQQILNEDLLKLYMTNLKIKKFRRDKGIIS